MSQVVDLDVLVVYSADTALSASVSDICSTSPFLVDSRQSNYNLSYAYFLKMCASQGIKAGFASSADIIGPGTCSNYWKLETDRWIKVDQMARAANIFDKLSPSSRERNLERELLLADPTVMPFNDPDLFSVFFDKLATFKRLPEYAIPTVGLDNSKTIHIKKALSRLNKQIGLSRYRRDFGSAIMLKDRFGAGGNQIYKIKTDPIASIQRIMELNGDFSYIIQPFLKFDRGYEHNHCRAATDIRLIFLRDKMIQSYIRIAAAGNFLCNEHQGGQLEYVTAAAIPNRVLNAAGKMVKKIHKYRNLYALDFVISNLGNVFFIEGNTGPGIDWDVSKVANEKASKRLIVQIVQELKSRLDIVNNSSPGAGIGSYGLGLTTL